MQVRADIKVIKTKFSKVIQAAAAQTEGSVSYQRFIAATQRGKGTQGRATGKRESQGNNGKERKEERMEDYSKQLEEIEKIKSIKI